MAEYGTKQYSEQEALNAGYNVVTVASSAEFAPGRGIHCNTAGTYYCKFRGGSANVKLVMNAGFVYPYSVIRVSISSTSNIKPTDASAVLVVM